MVKLTKVPLWSYVTEFVLSSNNDPKDIVYFKT